MERLEETQGSPLVTWTLLLLKKPMNISEFSWMLKEDSCHTRLRPKRPVGSFAKSSRKSSDKTRFHSLLPTTAEPSDSPTQTSALTTLSRLISKTEKSAALSNSPTALLLCSLEETTWVELVSCNQLRSIRAPSTSSMSRMLRDKPSLLESKTLSSLVTARAQPSPYPRAKVSSFHSWRREPVESTRMRALMTKRLRRPTEPTAATKRAD